MKRVVVLLSCLLLAGAAVAQEAGEGTGSGEATRSAEALEILKKVDTATKAVSSVRYRARSEPTGIATNFVSAAEGSAVMLGWNGSQPEKFWGHVKTTNREGEPVEITGGGNGDTFFLIDHGTRKAYEDMDPGVMGTTGRALQGIALMEFVHDAPFDDELGAEVVELRDEETVDGEPCHQIHVKYAGGQGESTWFFSKKDYLPRRRVRIFNIPNQGEGSIDIRVADLEVGVRLDDALFVMKLPEGYEQVDDFAP